MNRYSVIDMNGCKVIEGHLPLVDCAVLLQGWGERGRASGEEWICDALLSQHLGANLVAGPKAACWAWRRSLGLDAPESAPAADQEAGQGNTQAETENAPAARYALVGFPYPGITCLQCGWTSYSVRDIAHRFCSRCHDYLED